MAIVIIWSRGGPFRRRQVANKAKTWGRCLLFQEIDETGDKARNASFNKMSVTAGLQGASLNAYKDNDFSPIGHLFMFFFIKANDTKLLNYTNYI
jgi:hypothetical protein